MAAAGESQSGVDSRTRAAAAAALGGSVAPCVASHARRPVLLAPIAE